MTNPFGHNPFDANTVHASSAGMHHAALPPIGQRAEANTLATLSVAFAFVFAPAGAILGHLGLVQIRGTGQRGRDRALIGLTLSYVFIVVAVVALIVGAALVDSAPARVAAPATAPTPPIVATGDLPGLVPSLDDIRAITGDDNLAIGRPLHRLSRDTDTTDGPTDHPECSEAYSVAYEGAYYLPAVLGTYGSEFPDRLDSNNEFVVIEAVTAFRDAASAQTQLTKLHSIWRQCGDLTVKSTLADGRTITYSMSAPADAGNGITTMEIRAQGRSWYNIRAIAVKANVVIDLVVAATFVARARHSAVALVESTFGKIPG
ncbi:hypothetical protein A4G26_19980 [Mycobacterium kansasii]|uniref:Serine/threonine-protein kinase PknJ n=1 Tax=Mycobacterium innocens TaxID=2341083 RepID=A0A498QK68_9MYCO|nr:MULTISPECIES: sensor domain-containing protein [Mycobacterium]KZS51731.1 hypothetical protein A4G26_19980 [Mycobacterium kansasii]VBA45820.1 Serine/threonine-protein kinase PknJ [Mycobacterium innocens]